MCAGMRRRAAALMPLMLSGAVGMALCLRPDDPPVVIFYSVSPLSFGEFEKMT